MTLPRRANPPYRLLLAVCLCAWLSGCEAQKPVGDAQKYHPEGIGIDAETIKIPAKPGR